MKFFEKLCFCKSFHVLSDQKILKGIYYKYNSISIRTQNNIFISMHYAYSSVQRVRSFVVVRRRILTSSLAVLEVPEVPAAGVPKGPERKIVCPTRGQITSCPPCSGSSLEQKRMSTHTVWLAG